MIRILTVEREFGSGGAVIAQMLAARLGWSLWDQSLTDEIARRMDCDPHTVVAHEERQDPATYRLFRSFMRGAFEGNLIAPRLKMVDADCVREAAEEIVREVAERGNCVIVGRGSAYYLGGRSDAFHVFIYAPFAHKVRRLQSVGRSEGEATELAATVDRDRAAFIKRYFGFDWPPIHRFHLMINSSIGDEIAVDTILDAASKLGEQRA